MRNALACNLGVLVLGGFGACTARPGVPVVERSVVPRLEIEPSIATVRQGTSLQFRTRLDGLDNPDVAWSVRNSAGEPSAGGGTVSAQGLYVPGRTTGKWFFVHATRLAEPTTEAIARVEVVSGHPLPPVAWKEDQTRGWTLRFVEGQQADAQKVGDVVDLSLRQLQDTDTFKDRGIPTLSEHLTVFVHPVPGELAGIGQMMVRTDRGDPRVEVHVLAPSAHGSMDKDGWVPGYDRLYFHKNLVHELSTPFLEQLTLRKPRDGWFLHSAPTWFVQGIEEYLGCTLAADEARLKRYVDAVRRDPGRVSAAFDVREVYGDGCALVVFLYEHFGSEKVRDVLESPADTFWKAMQAVTGLRPQQLHEQWCEWLRAP